MKRLGSLLIFLLSLSIVLTACGGGGGGGGTTGGGGGGTTSSSVQISGLVGSGTSGSSITGAGLQKQQTSNVNPVESAKVEIKSYDASGNLIDSAQTATLPNTGGFNVSIKTISTGGYITISAVKNGFTTFEKTFTYNTIDDLKEGLRVLAEIDPVLTKVVSVFKNWTEPASLEDDTLSIAVVGDRRGRRQIVSGSEIKSATASGGEVIWQLDLSKSLLKKQEISSLKVEINNYDPSKPSDARRFPSETDVNGIKLVSTGFDFIDIRDDKGNPLKLSSSSLRTAALPQYRVARQIPNCSLIKCDENTGKDGVQVGFYMVKNGKWNKLGEATLYTSLNPDAVVFNLSDTDTCTDTTRPYAVVTEADLDFEYKWWNLDYPMGFTCDTIKEGCIAGIVNAVKQDSSKEPIKGLNLSLSNLTGTGTNFMGATSSGYTKNDGSYKIEFSYTGSLSNPVTTLSHTDPFTWMWSSKDYNLLDSNKDNEGCYVLNIDIADPCNCEVKGKVLKPNGTPAANRLVYVEQTNSWSGYRWKRTNDNGEYDTDVLCETEYTLRVGDPKDAQAFNVNSTLNNTGSYKESADSGSVVTMADLKLLNQNPTVYAYAWNTSVKESDVVQLYSWAWDPDEDPLTYSWTKTCGTFDNSAAQNPKWTAPTGITTDPTTCDLTVAVNDGQGGSDTKTVSIEVAALENRAPVITSLLVPRSVKAGATATLYVSAYDPDGDTITYSWADSCGGTFDTTTSPNTPSKPKWTAPTTLGDCTITVTVTDSPLVKVPKSASDSRTTTVYANRPPVITGITASPYPLSAVPKKKTTTLYPSAYDPDGDTLSYNWTATCGTLDSAGVQNPKWTAPDTETTCDVTLTVADPDNAKATKTEAANSVNTPPVITAFNVPDTVKLGDTVTLYATATDADGDTLIYTWYIQGTQVGTGLSYPWKPQEQGTYSIEVKVSDGIKTTTQSKNVVVSGKTSVDIIISIFKNLKGGE